MIEVNMSSFGGRGQCHYQSDLPLHIQHKVQDLLEQENLISCLETQLETARAERAKLYAELEPYRIGVVPRSEDIIMGTVGFPAIKFAYKASPIHRCPDEILCMIFKEYLIPSHTHIRRLLLVNRRWNRLVTSTPTLWSRIQLECGQAHSLLSSEPSTSCLPYFAASIERSRGLLLDMRLDFRGLVTRQEYIRNRMIKCLENIVDESEHPEVVLWANTFEFEFKSQHYDVALKRAFDCLLGPEREHMRRWSTLELYLPLERYFDAFVWNNLDGSTPNLAKVKLLQFVDPPYARLGGFPDLSAVTHFTFWDDRPISRFKLSPSNLRYLAITYDYTLSTISPLSECTNLEILKLNGLKQDEGQQLMAFPPGDSSKCVNLPQLKVLSLIGDYSHLCPLKLEFPKLDLLTVHSEKRFIQLPGLSPRRISWEIGYWVRNSWDAEDISNALKSMLLLSKDLTSIRVPDVARDQALRLMGEYKGRGDLEFLAQIEIEDYEGVVEHMMCNVLIANELAR